MLDKFAKFGQLASLRDRRLESLTPEEISGIAKMFGVNVEVTDELKAAGMALLAGEDLDTVGDMIQSPESVAQLVQLLKGGLVQQSAEPTQAELEVGAMTLNLL